MKHRWVAAGTLRGGAGPGRVWSSVLLVLILIGCSGGEDGPAGVQTMLAPSASDREADGVYLEGEVVDEDLVEIAVRLYGPTTSDEIHSVSFDILMSDPSLVRYVEGSVAAGDGLDDGTGTILAEASQSGGRVIVGAAKEGSLSGTGVGSAAAVLVTLSLEVDTVGEGACDLAFDNAAAYDHRGNEIPSVFFDPEAATITRQAP